MVYWCALCQFYMYLGAQRQSFTVMFRNAMMSGQSCNKFR